MEDKIGTWKIAADCPRRIATSRQLDGAAKEAKLHGESEKGGSQVCSPLWQPWAGNGMGQCSNVVIDRCKMISGNVGWHDPLRETIRIEYVGYEWGVRE